MSSQSPSRTVGVRIVIKLETETGHATLYQRLKIDNMQCEPDASILDCVRQAFFLCEIEKIKEVPAEIVSLLRCPAIYKREYIHRLDAGHGLSVRAVSTSEASSETLRIGLLVLDASNCGVKSKDESCAPDLRMITTTIPLLHAVVQKDLDLFTLEAIVIDNGQHIVNLCMSQHENKVIHFDSSNIYRQSLNRRMMGKVDQSDYYSLSHYQQRKGQWDRHVQFCLDAFLLNVLAERTTMRSALFAAYMTRSHDRVCASIFLV